MTWLEEHLNSIVLGDSYKLINQIPDKSVDFIYTDPPYLINVKEKTSYIDNHSIFQDMNNKLLTNGIDLVILNEFIRIIKHINIYIWCSKDQIFDYLSFFKDFDVIFELLTWHKLNPTPLTNNVFLPDTEYCLYFRERKSIVLNHGYHLKSKYYISPINLKDKQLYEHPTIKPLNLVERHILHSTKKE